MHIIIVEDNKGVANRIAYVLRDKGHAVDLIFDESEANQFLKCDGADVFVLDVDLPGLSGIEILKKMRLRGDLRPVLMLTARTTPEDKVIGLDAGADDYLAKPFDMSELIARLRALMRRAGAPTTKPHAIGPLKFDPMARQLHGPDGSLNLPRREIAIFEALLLA